jgi:plasmid maintenance system antidote protein VapI
MDKVKELINEGKSITQAIKLALAMKLGLTQPVTAFADKYQLPRGSVSNHLNATTRPTDDTIAALAAELGGSEEEWRELLWLAMRPAHLAAS